MSALNLLSRAREILKNRSAVGALVVVPLAMAARAQADSVTFGSLSVSQATTSGGTFSLGQATAAPTSTATQVGVHLDGNTVPPNDPSPLTYLPAGLAYYSNDRSPDGYPSILLTWNGTFNGTNPLTSNYTLNITPILSGVHDFGNFSWTLSLGLYDASYSTLLEGDSNSGTGAADLANQSFKDLNLNTATDQYWQAQLNIIWQVPHMSDGSFFSPPQIPTNPNDQLNATLSMDLLTKVDTGGSGINPVPLPSALSAGSALMALLVGQQIVRRRWAKIPNTFE